MKLSPSARTFLRGLQLITSVVALSTIAGSFKTARSSIRELILGSEATNFGMLMSYTAMLYALYQLSAEISAAVPAFSRKAAVTVDFSLAVLLVIAGIVLATSEYATNCDDVYFGGIHCGTLKTGTAFAFVSGGLFVVSAVLNAPDVGEDRTDIPEFVEESTPKNSTTTAASSHV